MADLDFYVIGNSKFDLVLWIDSATTRGDTGIKNVRDMVSKVAAQCGSDNRIARLTIVGHGNDSGQYIGDDWVDNENLRGYRRHLVKLVPLFGKNGEVVMGGCQQGRNGGLLLEFSNILGVPVSGYTAMQRPVLPGREGGKTTCFLTCTRQGFTSADRFDKIQLKLMEELRRLSD